MVLSLRKVGAEALDLDQRHGQIETAVDKVGARCTDRKPGLVVQSDPLTVTTRDRILIFRQTEEDA